MFNQKKKKIIYTIYEICLIISISVLIVICGEVIIKNSFFDIYKYMYGSSEAFILLISLIYFTVTFIYCMFNNIGIATIVVGFPYLTTQIINYYKFTIKGEYLGPSDISLIKEAVNISSKFQFNITWNMVWAVSCLLWMIVVTLYLKENIYSKKIRISVGVFSMVTALLLVNVIKSDNLINNMGISVTKLNTNANYENNGFLFTFINRLNKLDIKKPIDYNQVNVNNALDKSGLINKEDIKVKPNIIIIMSEAFTDISELPNVTLSEDPIPYFRQLQNNFTSGNTVTPVFGGFTSQVEYQVLSGNSTYFTDVNNIAYVEYINKNFPSMVSVLNNIGYNSIAIHPYKRDFYSRDSVYKNLGFSNFIADDNFINPDRIRSYITDQELVEMIISKFEEKKENPIFIHTVSMQNHGPYGSGFNKNNISVSSDLLSDSNKAIVSEYSNLLKESDNALKYLIKYFENIEEPTIILIFGDHKPVLGDNLSSYKELGVVGDSINYEQFYEIMHTPFVIWDNFGLEKKYYKNTDSSYLGAILLKMANLNYDKYFNSLYNQIDTVQAFNENFYIDSNSAIKSLKDMSSETKLALNNLWLLQYDRTFGNKYLEKVTK